MSLSLIESLPERCLELILDYLNLEDFNATVKCCKRLEFIGREVRRMREIRFHQVLRQTSKGKWSLLHPKDIKKKETSPGQRFGSTLVYFERSIYLFGGATVNWTTYSDLWRFDLSEKVWSRRITRGLSPPPRAGANGIKYKDKLAIIGGFELMYSVHAKGSSNWDNLPWIYDFTRNEWKMVMVDTSKLPVVDDDGLSRKFAVSPTPVGQSSCLMLEDQVVLFGGAKALLNQSQGYHRQNPIHPFGLSNDCFSLSLQTSEITPIAVFGDVKPPKRYGHSAMAIDSHKMVILGGNLGPNTKGTEDMWMLTCIEAMKRGCVCAERNNDNNNDVDPVWYWTKVTIDTKLQPLLPFINNVTVFNGRNKVTSTLVVLGPGPSDDDQTVGTTEESHGRHTVTDILGGEDRHRMTDTLEHIMMWRDMEGHGRRRRGEDRDMDVEDRDRPSEGAVGQEREYKRGRLLLYSVDLTRLLMHNQCTDCHGHRLGPVETGDLMWSGTETVAWTSPEPRGQDLGHAPCIKQGIGIACADDSLFIYGGVVYKQTYTRPVHLLIDLMVRDHDTFDDKVVSNADLHQLTFADPAISL